MATAFAPRQDSPYLARGSALMIFGVVLAVRLWMAAHFKGNFDTDAFRTTAALVLRGRNVYAETDLYNYSPLWSGMVAALWRLAAERIPTFVTLLGVLQTLSDAAAAGVVALIARRLGRAPEQARYSALLFFANPVSVVASSAHGQFDGLAILAVLVAISTALEPSSRKRNREIVLSLTASLLIKHVALFQPLLFWRKLRRGGLSGLLVSVPYLALVASLLPFASAWRAIWRNVIFYGTHGAWPGVIPRTIEVSSQFRLLFPAEVVSQFRLLFTAILIGGVVWALSVGRSVELPRASLVLWLVTLALLPGFAIQYLVWPLAVGCLYPSAGLGLYCLAASSFYCASPLSLNLPLPVHATDLGVWIALAFWLAVESCRVRAPQAGPSR